jgi:hypothetical protein
VYFITPSASSFPEFIRGPTISALSVTNTNLHPTDDHVEFGLHGQTSTPQRVV